MFVGSGIITERSDQNLERNGSYSGNVKILNFKRSYFQCIGNDFSFLVVNTPKVIK